MDDDKKNGCAKNYAQQAYFELVEIAKSSGYDPNGIKMFGKRDAMKLKIGRISSYITWEDGPENWTDNCSLPREVCSPMSDNMLVFYDSTK